MLSAAQEGTARTMYVGSMYLKLTSEPSLLSRLFRLSCSHNPMSLRSLFPDASVPFSFAKKSAFIASSPAPSATTTKHFPRESSRERINSARRLRSNLTSGMRQMSTSREDNVVCIAIKPASRPIIFTIPTPFSAALTSTDPAFTARSPSSIAVSNPKLRSMMGMSLSIVLGTAAIDTCSFLLAHSSAILSAPRIVPSPPITNTMLMFRASIASTIFSPSNPPRLVPKNVPPVL
mmetsp:Transcript_6631/g.16090  ORF Transcript_6631/g.16090 Transcript_6631/m.16090 type:complete len:234 (+) Transcript_6631:1795-2496(+)